MASLLQLMLLALNCTRQPEMAKNMMVQCLGACVRHSSPALGAYIYISTEGTGKEVELTDIFRRIGQSAYSYTVHDRCTTGRTSVYPTLYFLFSSGSDEEGILKNVHKQVKTAKCQDKQWMPTSRVIVILETEMDTLSQEGVTKKILSLLWSHLIYNSAVLVIRKALKQGAIFMADPFNETNSCGKNLTRIFLAHRCARDGDETLATLPFSQVDLKRFPNCSIVVSMRDSVPFSFPRDDDRMSSIDSWSGTEVKLVELLAQRVRLSVRWAIRPSPDDGVNVSQVHEYYKDIRSNKLDLAIGGATIGLSRYYKVFYLSSHTTQNIHFFVADNKSAVSKFRAMYMMFSYDIWFALLFVLVVSALVLSWYNRLAYRFKKKMHLPLVYILAIMLEEPINMGQCNVLRIFILSLVIPMFGITSIYTTYLHSFTIRPPMEREIETLDDLFESNYSIWATDTVKRTAFKIKTPKLQRLLTRVVRSPGSDEAAEILDRQRNFCILEKHSAMDYIITRDGFRIHKLKYVVTPLNIGLVMPKGSIFKSRTDEFINRCIEHGLYIKWENDVFIRSKVELVMREEREEAMVDPDQGEKAQETRALNRDDIMPAIVLLTMGQALAALVFLIELLLYRLQRSHQLPSERNRNKRVISSPKLTSFHY